MRKNPDLVDEISDPWFQRVSERIMAWAWTCILLFGWADHGAAAEAVLPEGSAPAPIVSRHFPDRVHEFVWRNWNAVAPAKLAYLLPWGSGTAAAVADLALTPTRFWRAAEILSRWFVLGPALQGRNEDCPLLDALRGL